MHEIRFIPGSEAAVKRDGVGRSRLVPRKVVAAASGRLRGRRPLDPGLAVPHCAGMLPPYSSEEVARAVQGRLSDAGVELPAIQVVADVRSRLWVVSVQWPGGGAHASYPFADASGIHTPREIAEWVAKEAGLR